MCKILTFSVQNHTWCVNLVILRKFCKKSHCFPGKFTQLTQILHDRRSRRSRQISTQWTQLYIVVHSEHSFTQYTHLQPTKDVLSFIQWHQHIPEMSGIPWTPMHWCSRDAAMQCNEKFDMQKTALSLAKSRLVLGSLGWLVVCCYAESGLIHRKMVVGCPIVITHP